MLLICSYIFKYDIPSHMGDSFTTIIIIIKIVNFLQFHIWKYLNLVLVMIEFLIKINCKKSHILSYIQCIQSTCSNKYRIKTCIFHNNCIFSVNRVQGKIHIVCYVTSFDVKLSFNENMYSFIDHTIVHSNVSNLSFFKDNKCFV